MNDLVSRRVAACSLVLVLLTGACEAPPQVDDHDPNGELVTNIVREPDTIDPHRALPGRERALALMVFEPLLAYDARTLRPIPAAADLPHVSADGLTYTFRLRDGIVFSDGVRVTAEHFVFSMRRVCDASAHNRYAYIVPVAGCAPYRAAGHDRASVTQLTALREAVGVRAVDERTIEYRLERPASHFASLVGLPAFVPLREADVASGGDWDEPKTFIGNGPFVLAEWRHGHRLVFERNERYRTPAKLKRWTAVMIDTPAVAVEAFRRGEVDVHRLVETGTNELAENDPLRERVIADGGVCTHHVLFDARRPPFDDVRMRRALASSIDRVSYVSEVQRGIGAPNPSLIPPGLPGADPDDPTQDFDVGAARRVVVAVEQVGYKVEPRLAYQVRSLPRQIQQVQWLHRQWRDGAGVDLVAVQIGGPFSSTNLPPPDPNVFVSATCAEHPDPQSMLEHFRTASNSARIGWTNAEFDRLLDAAASERDDARRSELYRRAQRILTSEAPAAFIASDARSYLVSSRVGGYALSAWGEFAELSLGAVYVRR